MITLIQSLFLVPLYLVFISIFLLAGGQKLGGGVPEWFVKQFAGTFLGKLPQAFPYYSIAVLELGVAVLFAVSAVRGEFLPGPTPVFLLAGLLLAQFTFFALGFGLRVAGDFQGAANLFMYFGITFFLFLSVAALPKIFS